MVIAGSKQFARTVSTRRVEIIRPKSPKSPAASASALKSADGSGDAIQNSDNGYMNTNGNLVSSHHPLVIVVSFLLPSPTARPMHAIFCRENCIRTIKRTHLYIYTIKRINFRYLPSKHDSR